MNERLRNTEIRASQDLPSLAAGPLGHGCSPRLPGADPEPADALLHRTVLLTTPQIEIYRQPDGARSEPACAGSPDPDGDHQAVPAGGGLHKSGCMVCGADITYAEATRASACHYCGRLISSNAQCVHGHFVCDRCHGANAVEVVTQICLQSGERDAVALMQSIRAHPRFGMHGPEHHALVPAVILAALRNDGQVVPDDRILAAIQRGQSIPGGACAFLGTCGAAIGVGIAVSILLGASPYDGRKRQTAQQATRRALERIASLDAPRCCQRDSWLALQEASGFLRECLGLYLIVNQVIQCEQIARNKECIQDRCPLWPHTSRKSA